MKIEARTGTRQAKTVDRFGVPGHRTVPVVELWLEGECFVHECSTPEEARALVVRMTFAIGRK